MRSEMSGATTVGPLTMKVINPATNTSRPMSVKRELRDYVASCTAKARTGKLVRPRTFGGTA